MSDLFLQYLRQALNSGVELERMRAACIKSYEDRGYKVTCVGDEIIVEKIDEARL